MKNSKRNKKKRRKRCLCHFGDDDIVIDNIRLNSVNILPINSWAYNQEVSFYLDDGDDIYFLIIRNNKKYTITLFAMKDIRKIKDIVIQVPMKGNTIKNLQNIIKALSKFPYRQTINYGEYKTFQFPLLI